MLNLYLKKLQKEKYSNSTFSKNIYIARLKQLEIIQQYSINQNFIKPDNKCLSCKFLNKNLKKKKNFIEFYKKFNVNLKFKSKYNSKFLAISKKEACFESYMIFAKKLLKCNEIHDIQKLNTILKINDLTIIKFSKHKILKISNQAKNQIQKNISVEYNLIQKYLK